MIVVGDIAKSIASTYSNSNENSNTFDPETLKTTPLYFLVGFFELGNILKEFHQIQFQSVKADLFLSFFNLFLSCEDSIEDLKELNMFSLTKKIDGHAMEILTIISYCFYSFLTKSESISLSL